MKRAKIILIGSQGVIGKILNRELSKNYDICCIDRRKNTNSRHFRADISKISSLRNAIKKIGPASGIIHLAADSNPSAGWKSVLRNNIIGTMNVYECARLFNIRKIIFASSNHVTGKYEGNPPSLHRRRNPPLISIKRPISPDGYYGLSKAFGEAIARYYSDFHSISSICLRIGTVRADDDPTKDKSGRWMKTWLSHGDMVQLFQKSLKSRKNFGIYYGVSNNTGRFWDISNAKRELGYHPVDDAKRKAV